MLNLVLIRHGKSSWNHSDLEDFERPLNDRGRSDIPLMARRISDQLPAPDRMLCSSAERAVQTARGLMDAWSFPPVDLRLVDDLYLAEPEDIMVVLRSLGHGSCVYLVGHNPGISIFAARLCGRDLGDLPTFATAHIRIDDPGDVDRHSWEHIDWDEGELEALITPKSGA
jgi:phosphohistidine phosphatase